MESTLKRIRSPEDDAFRHAMRRLCHFSPDAASANIGRDATEFILEQALCGLPGGRGTAAQIVDAIADSFGLQFEEEEITSSATRHGALLADGDAYVVPARRQAEVDADNARVEEREKAILESFVNSVATRRPELTSRDLECLRDDTLSYCCQIVALNGAEAVALLYGRDAMSGLGPLSITPGISDCVPPGDRRRFSIAEDEIPGFFDDPPKERVTLLADLLDATLYYYALSVDETCSRLLRKSVEGGVLYLDSNFLYHLFGFGVLRNGSHRSGLRAVVAPLRRPIGGTRRGRQRLDV